MTRNGRLAIGSVMLPTPVAKGSDRNFFSKDESAFMGHSGGRYVSGQLFFTVFNGNWLRGLDLNQRPLGYEPNELPGCSTPHLHLIKVVNGGQSRANRAPAQ